MPVSGARVGNHKVGGSSRETRGSRSEWEIRGRGSEKGVSSRVSEGGPQKGVWQWGKEGEGQREVITLMRLTVASFCLGMPLVGPRAPVQTDWDCPWGF